VVRCGMKFFVSLFLVLCFSLPVLAQDHLLFCNHPERITMPGIYANAKLAPGETYTIFYHYKNYTGNSGEFVVGLQSVTGEPIQATIKRGIADPQRDPPSAGRQAMARFLSAPERTVPGAKGYVRFDAHLGNRQVASGILMVRVNKPTRLLIYHRHSKWDVKDARVIEVVAPRKQIEIALSNEVKKSYYRIGEPEEEMVQRHFDGTYGMLYAFRVDAPQGSKVRVAFSPRGGKGGLVGSVNGNTIWSEIIPAAHWRVFHETVVGKNGLILTTAPFGGVFYPVELLFELL